MVKADIKHIIAREGSYEKQCEENCLLLFLIPAKHNISANDLA